MGNFLLNEPLKKLTEHEALHVNLGILASGKYTFYFSVINPEAIEFDLSIAYTGIEHQAFLVSGNFKKQNFNITLSIAPYQANDDCIVSFELIKGDKIFILPSLFPQLISDSASSTYHSLIAPLTVDTLFIKDEEKRERIKESYKPSDVYIRLFEEMRSINQSRPMSATNTPSVFYELLDLESSKTQLDYVVYNKLFSDKSGGAFSRLKRKIFRKASITVYKLITKSERRKNYIAKLYRNYVNVNYISEKK